MLAEIGAANGRSTYTMCDAALNRILRFTLRSLRDPETIEALAGQPQYPFPDQAVLPPASRLAFLEGYLARFPDALPKEVDLLAALPALRPLKSTELGGDMTLFFATVRDAAR